MKHGRSLPKRTLLLRRIRAKIRQGDWALTLHAQQQSYKRKISRDEIESAILVGRVIEDYPDDPRGPSCLVMGYTKQHRPIHTVLAYPVKGEHMRVITVYEPSADKWQAGWRRRR
ncbi:MAG: DUF4258 domain-containing protein [Candidatus Bipolaricaulia bacterium]